MANHVEQMAGTVTERFGEFLLPTGSFAGRSSATPEEAQDKLRKARCIMFFFYIGFTGVFVYTIVMLCFSGRVEVMQTGYKMDRLEAPSIAICPFNALDKVVTPEKGEWVEVYKYGTDGETKLDCMNATTPDCRVHSCVYDRECICVEMFSQQFQDHIQRDVGSIGTTGEKSNAEMIFRERFLMVSHIQDPSEDGALKVGFYDSIDKAPNWFYAAVGGYILGQLELQTWTVTDLTWEGIRDTFYGDWQSTMKQRHIFRYTSQEVARGKRGEHETRLSYEMKNFFVDDTVAAESAFSPYTLLFLLVLIAVRSAIIQVFINVMFPEWKLHTGVTVREISSHAETSSRWCSCCLCVSCFWKTKKEGSLEEREPLNTENP